MISNHTGFIKEPLTATNSNDVPTASQASSVKFGLDGIRHYIGNLALAVCGIRILITGRFTQAGGAGSAITYDQLVQCLVDKIRLTEAFHGKPIDDSYWKGTVLPWVSYVMNGYRWPFRGLDRIPAANGDYDFAVPIWVPLSLGLGSKGHHTAQLALMYQNAVLEVFTSASTVGTGISTGSSITSLDMRATAFCLPTNELLLGPAVEYTHYTMAMPASTSFLAKFLGFGTDSGLRGVENHAGLVWAALYDTTFDTDSNLIVPNITRIGVPFRDQPEIGDVSSFVHEAVDAMGPTRSIGGVATPADGTASDFSGYPYLMGTRPSQASENPNADAARGVIGLPLASPGYDLELSKLQRVGSNIQLPLTLSSAPTAGHIAKIGMIGTKAWTPQKREEWRELVIRSGLAARVLGRAGSSSSYVFKEKVKNKQSRDRLSKSDPKKFRWLPVKLVNGAA